MGLASSQFKLIFLSLYKSELEFKIQGITQTKLGIARSIDEIVGAGTDLDPESPEMKMLESRKHKLHVLEQQLDITLKRYETQLSAAKTEVESAQKFINDDIQSTFKYGGSQ